MQSSLIYCCNAFYEHKTIQISLNFRPTSLTMRSPLHVLYKPVKIQLVRKCNGNFERFLNLLNYYFLAPFLNCFKLFRAPTRHEKFLNISPYSPTPSTKLWVSINRHAVAFQYPAYFSPREQKVHMLFVFLENKADINNV